MNKSISYLILLLASTQIAFAEESRTFNDVLKNLSDKVLVNLIPVIVAVAFVTFLVGVLNFVRAGDNEEKRTQGRHVMVFGIVVLFVMISYWAFVGLITKSILGTGPSMPNYLPMGN